MRIRTVKPAFWTNEKMAALPEFARLLALGLLNYADDRGMFWANSKMIRGSLFPFEEDHQKVAKGLAQLESITYVKLGKTADGREVGKVVNFLKHQRVDKPQESEIEPLAVFVERSTNDQLPLGDQSALYGIGKEGIGKDPAVASPTDGRHYEITQKWGEEYRSAFGMTYAFAGRDASTLKRFLATNRDPAAEIVNVAAQAWSRSKVDRFASRCKEAATIHGLCQFFNEIRVELQSPLPGANGRDRTPFA